MGLLRFSFRRALILGPGLGAAWFASFPCRANAGTQELILSWSATTLTITSGGPFALSGTPPGVLSVNVATLNSFLAANGSDFQFASLSTSSNSPGAPADALLSITGSTQLNLTGGSNAIQITAADTNFTIPTGSEKLLGTATGILNNTTAGDSQSFSSWFNPSNAPGDTQQPAGTITFTSTGPVSSSFSGSTPVSSVTAAAPYSLTGKMAISLTPGTGATSQNQFAGTIEVGPNVPEPSMMGLLLLSTAAIVRRRRTPH